MNSTEGKKTPSNFTDISGEKFGKLLAISRSQNQKSNCAEWLCRCDCGNELTVNGSNLRRGNSTSCGCTGREKSSTRMRTLNLKHGSTNTQLFGIWSGIIERTSCETHDAYFRYGGRGIKLHESWRDFSVFEAYVGERPSPMHSIERIDNNKGYEPGNVKWATMYEQARNRRSNRWVAIDGVRMILTDAAKLLGIAKSTASRWLSQGRLTESAA